jgi:hypothetical protein
MPTPKKGLSPLARAQFGLSGKQIRRSVAEHNVKKSAVSQEVREASLPDTPEAGLPDPGDKPASAPEGK